MLSCVGGNYGVLLNSLANPIKKIPPNIHHAQDVKAYYKYNIRIQRCLINQRSQMYK